MTDSHLPPTSHEQAEKLRAYFRACLTGFAANPASRDLSAKMIVEGAWAAAGIAMELDEKEIQPWDDWRNPAPPRLSPRNPAG